MSDPPSIPLVRRIMLLTRYGILLGKPRKLERPKLGSNTDYGRLETQSLIRTGVSFVRTRPSTTDFVVIH